MTNDSLDATAIVNALNKHGVRYVVIGAFAAIAQRAPVPATRDIDFTPDTTADNLNRLSAALKELDARIRSDAVADGLPFDHDGASLGNAEFWNLICQYGEFDISFHPSGFAGGYSELAPGAHSYAVGTEVVSIADLGDVIRSKEAAGRPKDLQVLPALYRHHRTLEENA